MGWGDKHCKDMALIKILKLFFSHLSRPICCQVAGGQRGVGCMAAAIAGAWSFAAISASPVVVYTHLEVLKTPS